MVTRSQVFEFAEEAKIIREMLPVMNDEDARLAVGILVAKNFQGGDDSLTDDVAALVEEYKCVRPHLAEAMDRFIASKGTTEP